MHALEGLRVLTNADLQKALTGWDAGTVSESDVLKAQDTAAEDSVKRMEKTGSPMVTDGEQRISSYSYLYHEDLGQC